VLPGDNATPRSVLGIFGCVGFGLDVDDLDMKNDPLVLSLESVRNL